jgi:GntR family transcriptional regulator
MGFSETIRDAGYEPGARVLQTGAVEAPEAAVRQLLRASTVWQLKRVRLADETPIAIEHAFYPIEIGRELEPRDLTSIVMYRVFDDELKLDIKDAHQTVSATRADNSSAGLLGIEVGHPLLAMQRLTTSATGQPLELLRSLYLPDYFQFTIRLTRSPAANEGAS